MALSAQIHDLLKIDVKQFISRQSIMPKWAVESLQNAPFVVVRRGPFNDQAIPIGIRGPTRNQRWPAFCALDLVTDISTPSELLRRRISQVRVDNVPAFRALRVLEDRWGRLRYPWGPAGSIGFELVSYSPTATSHSDLDIVIRVKRHMSFEEAKLLCESIMDLSAMVDIRVETRMCGFSLIEYVSQNAAPILVRTEQGSLLKDSPWDSADGITLFDRSFIKAV